MNEDGIKQFLRQLDARNVKREGKWVQCSCLLAPYTHDKGTDSSPSMGVSIHEEDQSKYHCFTCKRKGTLVGLLEELEKYTGEDWSDLKEQFGVSELFGPPAMDWKRRRSGKGRKERLPEPLSEDYIDLYDPAEGHWYAKERGIFRATCRALQLRIDPDNRGAERLLFPVRDPKGRLYGFTGRATDRNVKLRVRDYHGLKKELLLLGAHRVTPETKRLAITEGPIDWARLCQNLPYPEVVPVAVLTSSVTPSQLAILKSFSLPVVNFLDPDSAGLLGAKKMAEKLLPHMPVLATRWPKGWNPSNDAADLTKAEAKRMYETAHLYVLPQERRKR